jgi:hypothetical protein
METKTEPRIDFVVRCLREAMPRSWPEIARDSGVPERTICKIAYRETRDPRSSTLDALFNYFVSRRPEYGRRSTDITPEPGDAH